MHYVWFSFLVVSSFWVYFAIVIVLRSHLGKQLERIANAARWRDFATSCWAAFTLLRAIARCYLLLNYGRLVASSRRTSSTCPTSNIRVKGCRIWRSINSSNNCICRGVSGSLARRLRRTCGGFVSQLVLLPSNYKRWKVIVLFNSARWRLLSSCTCRTSRAKLTPKGITRIAIKAKVQIKGLRARAREV